MISADEPYEIGRDSLLILNEIGYVDLLLGFFLGGFACVDAKLPEVGCLVCVGSNRLFNLTSNRVPNHG